MKLALRDRSLKHSPATEVEADSAPALLVAVHDFLAGCDVLSLAIDARDPDGVWRCVATLSVDDGSRRVLPRGSLSADELINTAWKQAVRVTG